MNYQRLPFSELFADPFFSMLGARARTSLYRGERQAGEFRRALQLPFEVNAETVQAHYGKGLLTIELSAQAKKGEKKIQILSGNKE